VRSSRLTVASVVATAMLCLAQDLSSGRPTVLADTLTNDTNQAPLDVNFTGFAELLSDKDGYYQIKTVKPGAYPAGGNRIRPSHIHFEVQGRFDRLITQMYFPGDPLNAVDPLLLSANEPNF
jgi:protocatechuate 3,4-dioxygenase beta subunit